MRALATGGLVFIAASLVACSGSSESVLAPSLDGIPLFVDEPPECIHVFPGEGQLKECGYDEPQVEGAPPSVYVDGQSVSEPNP